MNNQIKFILIVIVVILLIHTLFAPSYRWLSFIGAILIGNYVSNSEKHQNK